MTGTVISKYRTLNLGSRQQGKKESRKHIQRSPMELMGLKYILYGSCIILFVAFMVLLSLCIARFRGCRRRTDSYKSGSNPTIQKVVPERPTRQQAGHANSFLNRRCFTDFHRQYIGNYHEYSQGHLNGISCSSKQKSCSLWVDHSATRFDTLPRSSRRLGVEQIYARPARGIKRPYSSNEDLRGGSSFKQYRADVGSGIPLSPIRHGLYGSTPSPEDDDHADLDEIFPLGDKSKSVGQVLTQTIASGKIINSARGKEQVDCENKNLPDLKIAKPLARASNATISSALGSCVSLASLFTRWELITSDTSNHVSRDSSCGSTLGCKLSANGDKRLINPTTHEKLSSRKSSIYDRDFNRAVSFSALINQWQGYAREPENVDKYFANSTFPR